MTLKITIVTPSFNQASFLEQTIDSIHSQGYANIEHIIVDGGSTDGSLEIIKKHQRHLKYWVSEPDNGQSHAINKGLVKATGDVFNWINSDDFLEPGALQFLAEHFQDPTTKVVIGRSNIFTNDRIVRQTSGTDVYVGNLPKTIGLARIDQPETWFRSEIFKQITPLNEELHFVMDKFLWMKYLMKYGLQGITKTDEVIANFRWHESSKTINSSEAFQNETTFLFQKLAEALGLDDIVSLLRSHSGKDGQLEWHCNQVDLPPLIKSLHYYLIYFSDILYISKNYRSARQCLNLVNSSWLPLEDKLWYWKLKASIAIEINRFKR